MKLFSNRLKGKLQIPASKSYCHRYIIAASLAKEMSILHNISLSDDIQSTIEIMETSVTTKKIFIFFVPSLLPRFDF